ncbi:hypothetical protein CkaCkLH20_03869 [Colletotrichum karsti]|uniref:DUF4038 domain-containing protein n=1 Tax=Colletotrichum karsti TaxID=1095194 RepID=A0A9P6I9S0_9PEZI|nr:uncharacterized protein CkaCkLH20_03869 [Colletotrichum karsti]KAF9878377.1 hypothetical protein CkaCkLH20_03869 [Colletotrichum karsti]
MLLSSVYLGFCALFATCTCALPHSNKPWSSLAISASPNGRYLYREHSGEPFFWVADTNWELFHKLNRTDVDLYLADRAAKGFNIIQAVVLSKYNVTTIPNFYGDLAIDDEDVTKPNEGYFSYVDWVVTRAAEYGILICFVPTWGRYVNSGWYGTIGYTLFNEDNAEWFGRYLGKRYPGIPKMMGGDTNGFWANNVPQARQAWRDDPDSDPKSHLNPIEDTRAIWAAMMKGFKEEEAKLGYDAFVTFQPTSPWIADPPTPFPFGHNYINGSLGTLTMDAVQSGHESPDPTGVDAGFTVLRPWDSRKNYESIIQMREEFTGPVMDVENHYEGAHDSFNTSKAIWNASDVRHGYYPAVLSGACGITFGSLPVQQSYENMSLIASPEHYMEPQLGLSENASWHEAIHWPGAKQTGYVAKLFEGLTAEQFNSLQPARELISSPSDLAEDVLSFDGDRYIAGMMTSGYYSVYSGWGDAFDVDLEALAAIWEAPGVNVKALWFDPRTSERLSVEGSSTFEAKGVKTFTPPTNGGVDFDWVLIIKSNVHDCE